MVRTQSSENMGSGLRVCRVLTVGNAVTHLWLSLERLVFYHRHIMAERPTVSTCWHQKSDFWNLSLFYVPSKRSHLRCILYQAWYWSVDVSFTVPVTWAFFYRAVSHAVSGDGVNLQKHWTHFVLPVVTPGGDPLTLDFFLFLFQVNPRDVTWHHHSILQHFYSQTEILLITTQMFTFSLINKLSSSIT